MLKKKKKIQYNKNFTLLPSWFFSKITLNRFHSNAYIQRLYINFLVKFRFEIHLQHPATFCVSRGNFQIPYEEKYFVQDPPTGSLFL